MATCGARGVVGRAHVVEHEKRIQLAHGAESAPDLESRALALAMGFKGLEELHLASHGAQKQRQAEEHAPERVGMSFLLFSFFSLFSRAKERSIRPHRELFRKKLWSSARPLTFVGILRTLMPCLELKSALFLI